MTLKSFPYLLTKLGNQLTKNWIFQKMSITKNVTLKWYSSMKKMFQKSRIIFDVKNWLWKSEISTFGQLISKFWLKGRLFSVAKAGLRIVCGSWNSNLTSYLFFTLLSFWWGFFSFSTKKLFDQKGYLGSNKRQSKRIASSSHRSRTS